MTMADIDANPERKTTVTSDHDHQTTSVTQNFVMDKAPWYVRVLEALGKTASSIGTGNLIALLMCLFMLVMGWKIAPSLIEFLDTARVQVPMHTKILENQSDILKDIKAENAERNRLQQEAFKTIADQAKTLERLVLNQQAIIDKEDKGHDDHRKIMELIQDTRKPKG